ncbi:unnamed protein product, partial [Linum tenue]
MSHNNSRNQLPATLSRSPDLSRAAVSLALGRIPTASFSFTKSVSHRRVYKFTPFMVRVRLSPEHHRRLFGATSPSSQCHPRGFAVILNL